MIRIMVLSATSMLISSWLACAALAVEPEIVVGKIIVSWASKTSPMPRGSDGFKLRQDSNNMGQLTTSVVSINAKTKQATLAAIERWKKHPDVTDAEPIYLRKAYLVPNDTHYPLQWYTKVIHLEEAWDITIGDPNIVVAVIDSGIIADHPDLKERLLPGRDFISNPDLAGDGDGWDADPTDNNVAAPFHGTMVTGVLGATSNNTKGIIGVDWRCKVLPVRVIEGNKNQCEDSDVAAALRWAAGLSVPGIPINPYPARVINLSFGGPGYSLTLEKAVKDVLAQGVIVVAAAGNQNMDAEIIYPAAIPGVITVGATQYDGQRAVYSNYGKVVDVMAPGGDINQELPFFYQEKKWSAGVFGTQYLKDKDSYTYQMFDGTSVATPQVSGVVALMLAVNPTLSQGEVSQIFDQTSNRKSQCDEGCGFGLVNAGAAVAAAGVITRLSKDPTPTEIDEWVGEVNLGCTMVATSSPQSNVAAICILLLLIVIRGKRAH